MKSLLKSFRYISQMFEYEKEPKMQIGIPTDVKHIAHIGWDGESINQNSPTWMNNFKVSVPLGNIKEDASCISEDMNRARETRGVQKSSRSRTNNLDSRRGTSNSSGNPKTSRRSKESPDIPHQDHVYRKSRRKKSKDSSNGGSSRSSRRPRGSL